MFVRVRSGVIAQVGRPGLSGVSQRRSISRVHDGYTADGTALAGPGSNDGVALGLNADAPNLQVTSHDQALPVAPDDAEMASRSSRELIRVVQVEPDQPARNRLSALPYCLEVLGQP